MREHREERRGSRTVRETSQPCRERPIGPSRRAQAALPLAVVGAGMLERRLKVAPSDVVFVKGVIEACDGLAGVFAERGGDLLLCAPHGRAAELDALLAELARELEDAPR